MRAGQAGLALGVKGRLGRSSNCSSLLHTPKAGTDRTNGRSWSNQKPLHRGSRTCRPFAPNQGLFKEDRSFIGWLDVCRLRMRIILIRTLFVGRIWIPKGRELCCACEKRKAKKEVID